MVPGWYTGFMQSFSQRLNQSHKQLVLLMCVLVLAASPLQYFNKAEITVPMDRTRPRLSFAICKICQNDSEPTVPQNGQVNIQTNTSFVIC